MTAEKYNAVFAWFNARPAAKAALRGAAKGSVLLVYAVYAAGLGLAAWRALTGDWQPLVTLVAVPGAAFVLGTALRAAINRPRPYEALNFTPLFPKDTKGQSMPSRHCFAATAIAVTLGRFVPGVGVLLGLTALLIAVCRVLSGHHYPGDVVAGLAFGTVAALCGLWLCALLY